MIRPLLCSMTLAAMLWATPSNAENTAAATAPIVNGEAGDSGDFNSTVAILLIEPDGTYSAHCTGTLIGPRVVLTASHCIRLVNDDTNELEQTLTIDDLVVAVGALDAESAPDEKIRFADEVYYHDKFPNQNPGDDPEGLGQDYDIALLVLDKDVKSLPSTPVLPMNRFDKVLQEGDLVTISGYGNQGASDNAEAGELYIAETPYLRRSNYEFIAGEDGEPDACPGDSGGPVYVVDNGTRYVIGATARGVESSQSTCGGGGIYTLVPAYADWIDERVGDLIVTASNSGSANSTAGEKDSGGCSISAGLNAPSWSGIGLTALALGIVSVARKKTQKRLFFVDSWFSQR